MAEEATQETEQEATQETSAEETTQETEQEEVPAHIARASEHGWKDQESYVADGGDPDMWRGAKAFNSWHDYKKDNQSKIDKMQGQIEDFTTTFAKATKKQNEVHRKELEAALAKAETDNDIDHYKEVSGQIQELDAEEKEAEKTAPAEEHQVIKDFRDKTPQLNKASNEFNASFNALVESRVNEKVIALTNEHKRGLSEMELRTILNEELESVKPDFPHLFNGRKVKNPPKQGGTGKKVGGKSDPLSSLDKIGLEMYEHLKQNNPKAAEVFLKNAGN